MAWLDQLRISLLISLSILVVVILYRKFKHRVMTGDRPAPLHVELLSLQVGYHPEQLRAEVRVPSEQELRPAMLDHAHRPLHEWPHEVRAKGHHLLVLSLDGQPDGEYFFELATRSQRTVRKFKLQRA